MSNGSVKSSDVVAAQLFSAEQAWHHITVERTGVVDDIIGTLRDEGPYAYTRAPFRPGDGTIPHQVIETTKDGIADAYTVLHQHVEVLGIRPFTEIRTDWYTFLFGIGGAKSLATGESGGEPLGVLFPNHGQTGITGELFWSPTQPDRMGPLHEKDNSGGRLAVLEVHERLVDHLRRADVEAVVGMTKPDVQTAVRDYTVETNSHTELHGADELRSHLERLYERFTVRNIEVLHRHVEDWLVFSELWWQVELRSGANAGRIATFRTAELSEVAADGRLTSRIGHGTALELNGS